MEFENYELKFKNNVEDKYMYIHIFLEGRTLLSQFTDV